MRLKSLWIFFYSLKKILAAAFKNKIQSSFSKVKTLTLKKLLSNLQCLDASSFKVL